VPAAAHTAHHEQERSVRELTEKALADGLA